MTPFRKMFLAVAIVATGLGVAILLGEPTVFEQLSTHVSQSATPSVAATASPAEPAPLGAWAASSARLVPEKVAATPTATTPNMFEAPPLESHLATLSTAATAASGTGFDTIVPRAMPWAESSSAGSRNEGVPRASLRVEAPRPIGNEPRSPATIRRTPTLEMPNVAGSAGDGAYNVKTNWQASEFSPAGFASDGATMAATNATYNAPVSNVPSSPTVAQPADPAPWIAEDEAKGPRMHVVVDGDSLAKLANRYLDDPRRGAEIYELNRELLANPDLLPIGTELKIPDREAHTSWDKQTRRMGYPNGEAVRQAASGNLVPVRPMPSGEAIIPRAQLSRPTPVEL